MKSMSWPVILCLFLSCLMLFPSGDGYVKLEKVAVSSVPDDLLLPDLGSVTIDANGNVFAFAGMPSRGDCFIVKFDPDLKFVKKFGREGKGPGEFTTYLGGIEDRLSVDSDGNIYIRDANPSKLVIYDNQGNYREDIQVARKYSGLVGHLYRIKAFGKGRFIGVQWKLDMPPKAMLFTFAPPKIKIEYTYNSKRIRMDSRDFIDLYYGENNFLDTDENHFILGESQEYRFRVYDRDGNLKLEVYDKKRGMGHFSGKEMDMIRGTYRPKNETSTYYQLYNQKSKFNALMDWIEKSKNVIADIRLAGDRVFVFPVSPDITVKERFPVEIYDLKGKLLERACFKKIPLKIWKNFVFYYERDKEDNPILIKYKLLDLP